MMELTELLKRIANNAEYFMLQYSPDTQTWRAEFDDLARTVDARHPDPLGAIRLAYAKWEVYLRTGEL